MPNRTVLIVDGQPVSVIHTGQLTDDDRDGLQIAIAAAARANNGKMPTEIEITEVALWPAR